MGKGRREGERSELLCVSYRGRPLEQPLSPKGGASETTLHTVTMVIIRGKTTEITSHLELFVKSTCLQTGKKSEWERTRKRGSCLWCVQKHGGSGVFALAKRSRPFRRDWHFIIACKCIFGILISSMSTSNDLFINSLKKKVKSLQGLGNCCLKYSKHEEIC